MRRRSPRTASRAASARRPQPSTSPSRRRRPAPRVLLWDLDPQGAATYFFRVKPRVKGGVRRLLGDRGALAANIKETDVAGLHLVPADFSLRHLDVRLADGTERRRRSLAALLEPLDRRLRRRRSSTAPRASRSAARRCSSAADALLVPTVPTTLSVRTLDQLTDVPRRRRRRRRRCCRSCRCSTGARRCTASCSSRSPSAEPPFLATAIPNASAVERMAVRRAPLGEVAPRSRARKAFTDAVGRDRRPPLAPLTHRVFPAHPSVTVRHLPSVHTRVTANTRVGRSAVVDEGHGGGDEAEEEHQADADDRDDVRFEVGEVGVADGQGRSAGRSARSLR